MSTFIDPFDSFGLLSYDPPKPAPSEPKTPPPSSPKPPSGPMPPARAPQEVWRRG